MSRTEQEFVAITIPENEVASLVRAADREATESEEPAEWPTEGPCRISPERPVPYGEDDLYSVLVSGPLTDETGGHHAARQVVLVTADPHSADRSFLLDPDNGTTSALNTHPPGHNVPPRMAVRDRRFTMKLLRLLRSGEGTLGEPEPDRKNSLLVNTPVQRRRWRRTKERSSKPTQNTRES